jgi:hypothetical protein
MVFRPTDLAQSFASPWRYVLSPKFRECKEAEWERMPPLRRTMQLIGGIFCGLLGLVVVWIVVGVLIDVWV